MVVCEHEILWDYRSIDIRMGDNSPDGEFDEAVEFEGKCIICNQKFLKTFVDPRFTFLSDDNEIGIGDKTIEEFPRRENIKSQNYINTEQYQK